MLISSPVAQAVGDEFLPDNQALDRVLPEEVQDILGGQSAAEWPNNDLLNRMWSEFQAMIRDAASGALHTAGVILSVTMICALAESLDVAGKAPKYILLAGVAAVSTAAVADFDSYMERGFSALQTLSDFSHVLLPCLSAAAAASGMVTGAAAKYAATAMFMDVLLGVGRNVIMPAVCGYAALSVAGAAMGNGSLKAAKKLMKSICTYFLTGISLVFTGWLTLTGVISGTADAVTVRMTKTAVSVALPVVGSVLSDAAGALAAAVSTVRGTVGVFGVIVVICVCIGPFAALGIRYLVYKLAAAVCECVSDGKLAELIDAFGTCFGMILGLNGVGALMMFISVFSIMRTVV